MSVILFNESFVNIVTISFTSLILVEIINVVLEVTSVKRKMAYAIFFSFALYILSVLLFRTMFELSYINHQFVWNVILIAFVCCFPVYVIIKVMAKLDPSEVQSL